VASMAQIHSQCQKQHPRYSDEERFSSENIIATDWGCLTGDERPQEMYSEDAEWRWSVHTLINPQCGCVFYFKHVALSARACSFREENLIMPEDKRQ